jgi:hypothetical protein
VALSNRYDHASREDSHVGHLCDETEDAAILFQKRFVSFGLAHGQFEFFFECFLCNLREIAEADKTLFRTMRLRKEANGAQEQDVENETKSRDGEVDPKSISVINVRRYWYQ